MSRAHVSITTIRIYHAGRRRAVQICVSYISSGLVANIDVAVVAWRNNNSSADTAHDDITSPGEAVVGDV